MSEEQSTVEYRTVTGFPNYRVGSDGSVWHVRRSGWRRMKPSNIGNGYLGVNLYRNRKSHPKKVHRLVCEAFHGQCPEGMETRHFPDHNPANNSAANLSWATKKQNTEDKKAHGTHPSGATHNRSKMTTELADAIRSEYASGGVTLPELAKKHRLGSKTVWLVVKGKHWVKSVFSPVLKNTARGGTHCCAKLSDEQVREILRLWRTGEYMQKEIAARFGVRQNTVSRIVNGKMRSDLFSVDLNDRR